MAVLLSLTLFYLALVSFPLYFIIFCVRDLLFGFRDTQAVGGEESYSVLSYFSITCSVLLYIYLFFSILF